MKYMINATGGEIYDFKTRGLQSGLNDKQTMQYYYRGNDRRWTWWLLL